MSQSKTKSAYDVRLLTAKDIPAADELWTLAFSSGWARDWGHKELHRIFGAFEGDDLHAVAGVLDYKMTFGDALVDCGGIGAVATVPGQRSQQLIQMLLTEAVREMDSRGVVFSSLYPFSFPFYERAGYAASHWTYLIETTTAWLKKVSKGGNAKRYRMVTRGRCHELLSVYERWHQQFNLALSRTESKFHSMIHWPEHAFDFRLFLHDDGYILMDIARDPKHKQLLRVHEFAYLNESAYLDGLALLGQMDTQFEFVKFQDSDVQRFLQGGVPYPKPLIEKELTMMTRVVNRKAFEALVPNGLGNITLRDPLGVTAGKEGDVGVGEIVQIVTGFFDRPDNRCPWLYRAVADKPTFTVEKY